MKKDSHEEAERWIKQAEVDFASLSQLFKVKIYHLVCFMAQQAAEKALKAHIYAQGEELILTHSVAKLCNAASEYDASFEGLGKSVKNLDSFYIQARYPNGMIDGIFAEFFEKEFTGFL
ncbi:MAG: HEPN domain-containing protein [Halobacteriota archaeon]|nr:HEPN domain-containing protein [Halobacteriota archaeon]